MRPATSTAPPVEPDPLVPDPLSPDPASPVPVSPTPADPDMPPDPFTEPDPVPEPEPAALEHQTTRCLRPRRSSPRPASRHACRGAGRVDILG